MKLVRPESIPHIDAMWIAKEEISEEALIRRAGAAVAAKILALPVKGDVLILSGGGNNGADGYAAALSLHEAGVSRTLLMCSVKGRGAKAVALC